jgi:hypothetical protein
MHVEDADGMQPWNGIPYRATQTQNLRLAEQPFKLGHIFDYD